MLGDRFSAEVSVSSQGFQRTVEMIGTTSEPVTTTFTGRLYPIDANVSYDLLTNSRWKPYIGAGVRYVNDTFHVAGRRINYYASRNIDPEVTGGITLQLNPSFGLRLDAKQVLGSYRSAVTDPDFKASVGLSFSF